MQQRGGRWRVVVALMTIVGSSIAPLGAAVSAAEPDATWRPIPKAQCFPAPR